MVKQGRELSLFVEQTFADDTAGHWCLARSGPWYKSVRTTGGGMYLILKFIYEVRFTDIYEICRYCSSSKPIILLRSNKAFSAILRFRALTSNWHIPETDETSATSLNSGVSKSSIRYVSTSPEGWIGSTSKSGRGSEGPVKGFGQGRPMQERE
ncbi:hypothetical protein ALC53_10848 [Atta colombica]|uniref:Uncharacterized protein n=1 Tax=Atta colombica TaxID=520822 RepID=A0A195B3M1_9HYME|nr:hypothetical protein ALC53_10848 [Atta colombica]